MTSRQRSFKQRVADFLNLNDGISVSEYLDTKNNSKLNNPADLLTHEEQKTNTNDQKIRYLIFLLLAGIVVGIIVVANSGNTEKNDDAASNSSPATTALPAPTPRPTPTPDLVNGPFGLKVYDLDYLYDCIDRTVSTYNASVTIWNSQLENTWEDLRTGFQYLENLLFETGEQDIVYKCGTDLNQIFGVYSLRFAQLIRTCSDITRDTISECLAAWDLINEEIEAVDLRWVEITGWVQNLSD